MPYFGFVQVELPGELPVDPGRYPLRPAEAGRPARAGGPAPAAADGPAPAAADGPAPATADGPAPATAADDAEGGAPGERAGARSAGAAGELEAVLVVTAPLRRPRRRRLRRPRPRPARDDEPDLALTALSVIDPSPLQGDPERWLEALRRDDERRDAYVERGLVLIRRALGAARIAALEPGVGEPSRFGLRALRVGFGSGEQLAAGRWQRALSLPQDERLARREALRVGERFAALVGGRERALAGEELLLRARADLAAGREREAVLQAELALRALLAARAELRAKEAELAELEAAAAALARHAEKPGAEPEPELLATAQAAVSAAERILRRRQAQASPPAA